MKTLLKKYYRLGGVAIIVLASAALLSAAHLSLAASPTNPLSTLTLSPSSQTVTTGSNVVVSIVLNTNGNGINSAQSEFTYSATNYSLVSITGGASFSNFQTPLESSGIIEFSAATAAGAPAVSGTQTVAVVTLHATGTGTSALGLGTVCGATEFSNPACSAAYDSTTDNNDLTSASGVSYTVNAAVVTPPPTTTPPSSGSGSSGGGSSGSTGSGGSSSKSSGSGSSSSSSGSSSSSSGSTSTATPAAVPTPTSTPTNPAPVISDISITNITGSSAVISWHTNVPSTSVVNYGLDTTYGLLVQNPTLTTAHQISLGSPALAQGTHYFLKVSSATATGASNTSNSQEFTTTGFTVTIRVVDAHGKLVKGAKVFLNGQTEKTNSAGIVTLTNVPAGAQTVSITINGKITRRTITVTSNSTSGSTKLQQFSLSAARGATNPLYYIITILIIFMATGGALFMPRRRLHHFQPALAGVGGIDPDIGGTTPPVTSDSGSSDQTASLIDSVNPDTASHEPGQIIAPTSADETGTSDTSDDDAPNDDTPQDPPEPLDPAAESPGASEPEETTPEAEEAPAEPAEPEAPAAPEETPEPATPEPAAEEPADTTPAPAAEPEPEPSLPPVSEESTPPEPAEPEEPAESADTEPAPEPSESADTTETPEPAESADTAPPTTPEADPPEAPDDPSTPPDAPA